MSYIEPNSTMILLGDVHIDNSYENTGYFASATAQYNYFSSKAIQTFNNLSYQRVNKGTIRVQANYGNVYNASYMMFKNTDFENKWFYAFVNKAEYINNNCVEITYEIDVIQTWYFETHYNRCFVVREHVADDSIGANIVEEGLDTGEYYSKFVDNLINRNGETQDNKIFVMANVDVDSEGNVVDDYTSTRVGQWYSGAHIRHFNSFSSAEDFLKAVGDGGKADAVLSVYELPFEFHTGNISTKVVGDKSTLRSGLFEGYAPKNNKLYTYPYCMLYVTNYNGSAAKYPLEYFTNDSIQFSMAYDYTPSCETLLFPNNYRGDSNGRDFTLSLTGFPQCAFNTDSYKAYLAQNASSQGTSIGFGFAKTLLGVGTVAASTIFAPETAGVSLAGIGVGVSTAISGASQIANVLSAQTDRDVQPAENSGTASGLNVNRFNHGYLDFGVYVKYIQKNYAQPIDDYFTMYGYKVNKVKVPQPNIRPYWTYIQTIGCDIDGSAPADAIKQMNAIHDKGVRFWTNLDNVGRYDLTNK